jgi:hypothetical protein
MRGSAWRPSLHPARFSRLASACHLRSERGPGLRADGTAVASPRRGVDTERMTRVIWEHYEQTPLFEDMVSVLISYIHPRAERIDGSGGDGGRDVQVREQGRLDAFEIKSFTGRITARNPDRRGQVEGSLSNAARLNPQSWTLIVPIDPTPKELEWFDNLRDQYSFPLVWLGRTWLDGQMAAHPEVRRYYLEGAADEVVALLQALGQESAAIRGVADVLPRFRVLRDRLQEVDPHYDFELIHGRVEWGDHPYAEAVTYKQITVDDDIWTVAVIPKYKDAVRDRPLFIRALTSFATATEEGRDALLGLPVRAGLRYFRPSHLRQCRARRVESTRRS